MQKQISFYRIIPFMLTLFFCISCENSSSPDNPNPDYGENFRGYGVVGTVKDTSGNPIEGVKVYPLYHDGGNMVSLPETFSKIQNHNLTAFNFNLEQNFPNPFSINTFIRFTIPADAYIELEIRTRNYERQVFLHTEYVNEGYYQYFLENFDQSLNIKPGIYKYTLTATYEDTTQDRASKELLLSGSPSAPTIITGKDGLYTINYSDFLIGETIIFKDYDSRRELVRTIDNTIALQYYKEGYKTAFQWFDIYPKLLFTRDILMEEEHIDE